MNAVEQDAFAARVVRALELLTPTLTPLCPVTAPDPAGAAAGAATGATPAGYLASIHFRRDRSGEGWVELSATAEVVVEIAGALLAEDPASLDPEIEGRQALAELANIFSGELIFVLGGELDLFRLDLPESSPPSAPSAPPPSPCGRGAASAGAGTAQHWAFRSACGRLWIAVHLSADLLD